MCDVLDIIMILVPLLFILMAFTILYLILLNRSGYMCIKSVSFKLAPFARGLAAVAVLLFFYAIYLNLEYGCR